MHQRIDLTDDRGAVVMLFAIFLGTGVIMALFALVVDVGQAYVGRGDAKNTADIIATSLAYQCASGISNCATAPATTTANTLATANATNKRVYASVTNVCGTNTQSCAPVTKCTTPDAAVLRWVRVSTTASSKLGTGVIPLSFAPMIGRGDRTSYSACAQASWGQVAVAPLKIPIVFSVCNFHQTTAQFIPEWTSNAGTTSCSGIIDYDGTSRSGNFNGFFPAKSSTGTLVFDSKCAVPLNVSIGDSFTYEASDICKGLGASIADVFNAMLNVPTLVPVASTIASSKTTVFAFAQFTLRGFIIANTKYGDQTIPWPDSCKSNANTNAGNKCIYGSYSPVVISYQQIRYDVPNLGVNSLKPLP